MKKIILLLLLIGTTTIFTNCNNDEDEDLTIEITGEYIGQYSDNSVGTISSYEIIVAKVDVNHVSVRPKSSNEFNEFEIEIERINSSSLSSPTDDNQQLERSVSFTLSIPATILINLNPTGDAKTFSGMKQ